MTNYLKRYVCKNTDLDNKVCYYEVDLYHDTEIKEKLNPLPFEKYVIIVSGIPLSIKGGRFDKLNKGFYKIKESDWKEISKYLYDTCDLIEKCDENWLKTEKVYMFMTEKEFTKKLKEVELK